MKSLLISVFISLGGMGLIWKYGKELLLDVAFRVIDRVILGLPRVRAFIAKYKSEIKEAEQKLEDRINKDTDQA